MLSGAGRQKLAAIQLLRAIATIYVATIHVAYAFVAHLGDFGNWLVIDGRYSQAAVALFFIVSGYIMVVSSRRLFGQHDAQRIFWTRRAIRILPPYWIATAILALLYIAAPRQDLDLDILWRSVFFVPYWIDAEGTGLRFAPLVWPGWTLLYELLFYAIFGFMIRFGRSEAIAGTAFMLLAIAVAGIFVPPVNPAAFQLTRAAPVIFIFGMALALMRERGRALPPWVRVAALVAMVPAALYIPIPDDLTAMDFHYVVWCGTPAVLFAVAVLGGPLKLPLTRLVNALGDMSYALYLLHIPMAWLWVLTYRRIVKPDGPWLYFLSLVTATMVASWLFFLFVEKPLTRWLNDKLGVLRHDDDLLQQTGV